MSGLFSDGSRLRWSWSVTLCAIRFNRVGVYNGYSSVDSKNCGACGAALRCNWAPDKNQFGCAGKSKVVFVKLRQTEHSKAREADAVATP